MLFKLSIALDQGERQPPYVIYGARDERMMSYYVRTTSGYKQSAQRGTILSCHRNESRTQKLFFHYGTFVWGNFNMADEMLVQWLLTEQLAT